jgi:DNA mismatch repair protein MutL
MYHNGSEVFNLPKSNYRQRIVNIFGNKMNEKLVPVNENTDVLDISGFVGKPEYAKKSRGEQFFFVNNRFIKSPYLNHAISSAFHGLLKDGAHASYFLNLTVDPQTIDINIHPTKTEIKFDDEQTLYALLRSAVKHSLGQFNIAPVLDFDRDSNLDTPYSYNVKNADSPTVEVDKNFNPFQSGKSTYPPSSSSYNKEISASWEGLYVGLESKGTKTNSEYSEVQYESEEQIGEMFTSDTEVAQEQSTSQLRNKYIISHIKSGMLVIDQHRAHQRILYEDYLQQMTGEEAVSQQLLFPIQLHFSLEDMKILEQVKNNLESTGFDFASIDAEYVEIKGTPSNVLENQISAILEDLINDVKNEVPDSHFSASDLMAKSMAKSLAIKTGQSLSRKEREHIVNRLFGCKEPNISPDNKPTFITVTMEELDRKF